MFDYTVGASVSCFVGSIPTTVCVMTREKILVIEAIFLNRYQTHIDHGVLRIPFSV